MLRSMYVRCTCSTNFIVARSSHAMTKLLPTIASGIAMSTYVEERRGRLAHRASKADARVRRGEHHAREDG